MRRMAGYGSARISYEVHDRLYRGRRVQYES